MHEHSRRSAVSGTKNHATHSVWCEHELRLLTSIYRTLYIALMPHDWLMWSFWERAWWIHDNASSIILKQCEVCIFSVIPEVWEFGEPIKVEYNDMSGYLMDITKVISLRNVKVFCTNAHESMLLLLVQIYPRASAMCCMTGLCWRQPIISYTITLESSQKWWMDWLMENDHTINFWATFFSSIFKRSGMLWGRASNVKQRKPLGFFCAQFDD